MFRPNLSLEIFYDTELNSAEEGPNRGLLRDYESSDGPSFQAVADTPQPPAASQGSPHEKCTDTEDCSQRKL